MRSTEMEETDPRLQQLLDAAANHGMQSDPDMEAGDLAEILIACWSHLNEKQRNWIFEEFKGLIEEWIKE
jgi:hypothetical protein